MEDEGTKQQQDLTQVTIDDAVDPIELNDSWWLIRNSKGKGSVSTTLLVVSFILVAVSYLLNMFNFSWVKPFDIGACAAFFSPICALYFARRQTESKEGQGTTQP